MNPNDTTLPTQRRYPVISEDLKRGFIITRTTYVFDDIDVDVVYRAQGVELDATAALLQEIWAADNENLLLWNEHTLGVGHHLETLTGFVEGSPE